MGLPRPPGSLAACAIADLLAFAFNVRSPLSVPAKQASVTAAVAAAVVCYGWLACLQLAVGGASALGQASPPSSPEIWRIIISRDAPLELQGTAAPGDRIVIRVDDRIQAETRADGNGRWQVQLPNPLPPGDHKATVVAYAPGSDRERGSEGVQITLPHAFMPNYAPSNDERDPGLDSAPPNAATRRLAAELAREAHQEFSKITSREDGSSEREVPDTATAEDEISDESAGTPRSASHVTQPGHWLDVPSAWLARAHRDYMEVVVAALSDPERRGELTRDRGSDSVPPLPDRPQHEATRAEALAVSVLDWLRRASRDYQDYVVRELALRGIEDPQQRQIARLRDTEKLAGNAKSSGLQSGGGEDTRTAEPASTDTSELSGNDERAAGPYRPPGEGGAPRKEVDARSLTQRLPEQAQLEPDRRSEPAPSENARRTRPSETLLPEGEQSLTAANDETSEVEIEAVPPDEVTPAYPDLAEKALIGSSPAASVSAKGEQVSPAPPPTRLAVQDSTAINIPARNPRTLAAALQENVVHPPLPPRAQVKMMVPPIPTRPLRFVVHPPPPERLRRRPATSAKAASTRTATSARRRSRAGVPPRTGPRKLRNSRARNRWCNNPAAGRAIRTPGTYIVAYGDTLWDIAERHYAAGHLYSRIQRANRGRIRNPDRIYPCQRIKIPRLSDSHR